MPDWIISNAERQELEHLSTRLGEIIANLRQRPAETTPMPPPPGLGQHVVHPDHAPFCDGTCVRYGRGVNCPDPDAARLRYIECEEHDHDRYGDCDGPVTEFEQNDTRMGKTVGSRVNLCASHARQAGMRGAVRWTISG